MIVVAMPSSPNELHDWRGPRQRQRLFYTNCILCVYVPCVYILFIYCVYIPCVYILSIYCVYIPYAYTVCLLYTMRIYCVYMICVYTVCMFVLFTFQSLNELQLRARRLSRLFFYGSLQLLQHFLFYMSEENKSGTELHHSAPLSVTVCFQMRPQGGTGVTL